MLPLTENACNSGTEKAEAAEGRDPKTGKWLPGFGGGGGGRKRGSRHKATILAQAMIDDEGEEIIRGVIEGAKAGDPVCVRLAVERLVPVRKSAPVKIELPHVESTEDAKRVVSLILAQQADGELTADEAAGLLSTVEAFLRVASIADLEARIARIEGAA